MVNFRIYSGMWNIVYYIKAIQLTTKCFWLTNQPTTSYGIGTQ